MKRGKKKYIFKITITILFIILAIAIVVYSLTVYRYTSSEFKKNPLNYNIKNPCSKKNIEYDSCRVWVSDETYFDKCNNKAELKDICFFEIAVNTYNEEKCKEISNDKIKENCVNTISIIPIDPNPSYLEEINLKKDEVKKVGSASTCEGIADETLKQNCENSLNELTSLK